MDFPVFYFTMADGSKLRATFEISGFDWVHINVAERSGFWVFRHWSVRTNPYSGRSMRLREFIKLPKAELEAWAKKEVLAWHEYSKLLKSYKP